MLKLSSMLYISSIPPFLCFTEEKLTGVKAPRKSYEIQIPFKHDPFDPKQLSDLDPLPGEEVFRPPNNNTTVKEAGSVGPWGEPGKW